MKIIFGIQAAKVGLSAPLIANWEENCMNNIYAKLNVRPAPI